MVTVVTRQGYYNTLRMEVNEHGIGVTLVCPGPVQTDVVANAFTEDVNKVWKNQGNLVLSTKLITKIGHHKEFKS